MVGDFLSHSPQVNPQGHALPARDRARQFLEQFEGHLSATMQLSIYDGPTLVLLRSRISRTVLEAFVPFYNEYLLEDGTFALFRNRGLFGVDASPDALRNRLEMDLFKQE